MTALLDTGPLVALLNGRDEHHLWARGRAERFSGSFLTCEAVLTEALFLLGRTHAGREHLFGLVEQNIVAASFSYAAHASRVHGLMRTYANVPMSFADGCLVCMAELHPDAPVFTTAGDFRIYRKHRDEALNLLIP